MAKKMSKTALNIDSINRYIQTVANLFGTNSAEYEAATIPLKGFATRDKFVNGQAVIQLQNSKANRKKHQAIRAIKNKRKPVSVLKRKYEKKRREYQEQAKNAGVNFDDGAFYRWYAELEKQFSDLISEIYGSNGLVNALGAMGENPSDSEIHAMFKDESYRSSQWERVYNAGGMNYTDMGDFINSMDDDLINSDVDINTGENMTFTNDDYDMDMEFD